MPMVQAWQVVTITDTWQSIANTVGVTRAELWAANGLAGYRPLVDGELLRLPFALGV